MLALYLKTSGSIAKPIVIKLPITKSSAKGSKYDENVTFLRMFTTVFFYTKFFRCNEVSTHATIVAIEQKNDKLLSIQKM